MIDVENIGFFLIAYSFVIGVIGYLWLMARAFRVRVLWGLGLFIPLLAPVFIWRHFRKVRGPVFLLLLAAVVFATPYGLNYYETHFVPLKPHERIVNGELRVTLTGLKDFDYSTLRDRPDIVVLQMANEDVDDRTLEYLRGMDRLRTLDLSGARVTDEGLRVLADLPRLQELRLARTKITDEGFQKYLGPKESLRKVDLTGTGVKGKTKRDWKKRKPEEREFVD